jgi:Pretoxin HINT domain
VDYLRHHPEKPAPVTRPRTTAKPEFSCGGPYAGFKGWKLTCEAAQSKKPVSWQALGIAGLTLLNVLQLGGDPVTDAAELALLDDLTAEQVDEVEQLEQEEQAASCVGESFTADTKVLLASGVAIAISKLKAGDKVLATNVKTGKTQPETVAAVLVHHDTDLYDLKVTAGHRTAVIHTTASHLFWDTTTRRWVTAAAFHPGDHLRTPGRTTATAAGGYTPKQQTGSMWDLTIPTDHDFYISTVVSPVLVHNCGPDVRFGHGVRHLAGTGLKQEDVEAAIEAQIKQQVAGASSTGSFWGRVIVEGQTIEYRAFTLSDGTINVGTYVVPK